MSGQRSPLQLDCPPADELTADADWWGIYQDAFPTHEREPGEVIVASLRRGVGVAVRGRVEERTVALATLHLLREVPAVFLVYLAVDRAWRSQGFGAPLFDFAWQEGRVGLQRLGLNARGMIWEVEDPATSANEDERATRSRRLAFFARRGAHLLERPYAQPPLHGGGPVPMRLMYRPAENATVPTPTEADALVRAAYFEKYGGVNQIPEEVLTELLARKLPGAS